MNVLISAPVVTLRDSQAYRNGKGGSPVFLTVLSPGPYSIRSFGLTQLRIKNRSVSYGRLPCVSIGQVAPDSQRGVAICWHHLPIGRAQCAVVEIFIGTSTG